jgi:hypothetical protein
VQDLTVEVDTQELLKRIRENRDKHRAIFESALEGFKTQVIEHLERRLEQIRKGKLPDLTIRLPQPEDHTEDYDCVIDMLETHTKDTIQISNLEFAMYVRDDWQWKRQFNQTVSNYTALA